MTRATLAILLAAAALSPAHASPFRQAVLKADTESMMLLDLASIEKVGSYQRAWMTQINAAAGEDKIGASRVMTEFDCDEGAFRVRRVDAFDASNNLLGSVPGAASWRNAPPETAARQAIVIACDRSAHAETGTVLDLDFAGSVEAYRHMVASGAVLPE